MSRQSSDVRGWVRVAGTGRRQGLPNAVLWTAEALGRALGRDGYGVVTGGWPGVDYIVCDAFHSELRRQRRPLSGYLIQVVAKSRQPDFQGGHVVYVEPGPQEWIEGFKCSDVVVLIGGEGGVYMTYSYAEQEQLPTFPIAGTEGDSRRVFGEMLSHWELVPLEGISKDDFRGCLGMPIRNRYDADLVVEALLRLLHVHLTSASKEKSPIAVSVPPSAADWDLAAIRHLLQAAYKPHTLHRFCQERPAFRPIVNEFGPGLGLNEMVDCVIDYCDTQLLFDELLAEVGKENPRQYERFEPYQS